MNRMVLVCVALAALAGCKKKEEHAANSPAAAPEKAVEQATAEVKLAEPGAPIGPAAADAKWSSAVRTSRRRARA